MIFRDPRVFVLLPFMLAAAFYLHRRHGREAGFKFSSGELLKELKTTFKLKARRGLVLLKLLALIAVLTALARPQSPMEEAEIITEGIDIVLAVDVSTSMRAEDFVLHGQRQNRLEVVKDVVKEFIQKRHSDRIGMVVFAGRAYTICPLTLDYQWLLQNLERVRIAMVEDGTAIGSGINAALNRLKNTEAKSKIIILLTDGRNNAGKISPLTAAEAAKALKIRVYAIGAGSEDPVPYPFTDAFGRTVYRPVRIEVDDYTLAKIALITGGKYYNANDTKALRDIYAEIDRLEKVPIKERGYFEYKELFPFFLIPGLLLLLLGIVLDNTVFRKIP